MTTIAAEIIADSIGEHAPRLTTMLLRYPRCIHSEMLTHRLFSRNSASSRAIPVAKMIKDVMEDPFVPMFWGKNQKGMQSVEECDELVALANTYNDIDTITRECAWLRARDYAIEIAKGFDVAGYHKQLVNRLLEPFAHITVVVTSTQWSNFFALRRHEAAEPHIHMLADRMFDAMSASVPRVRKVGEWHLPFVSNNDWLDRVGNGFEMPSDTEAMLKLSVARCASTSYKTVDGFDMSLERAVTLHDKLVSESPLHASPCEHQAKVDTGKRIGHSDDFYVRWDHPNLGGNLGPGWIQYRKTLAGEAL